MPQYEVQAGDTLYDIAQKTTGDGNRWREIYDQNKTTIGSDPGMIHPGQVYSIPYDQAAVNEGNSMGYGSQSQGDYPAPSIQPYNSRRYPDPNRPNPTDTAPSYSPAPPAGMSPPSSGAGYSLPQNPPAAARSLTKNKEGQSVQQQRYNDYSQARSRQGYATTGGYPGLPRSGVSPSQTTAQPQGPSNYTPQMSADAAYRQLSPREQMAGQMAPDQRAQMGVQITPPLQAGIDEWRQRAERNQRLGVPDTSPSPQVQPVQARPAQGYGPSGGSAGPQSNQQLVQWPAPPNPVGPQSYQGRFQTNTGAPRTIDAYHGYMGRPFQGSSQPMTPPQQVQPQQVQPQQPRAVIVIQADGSAIVYDPATGQWRQQQPAPTGRTKGLYSQIPQTVPMDTVGSPVNYDMQGVQPQTDYPMRPPGQVTTLPVPHTRIGVTPSQPNSTSDYLRKPYGPMVNWVTGGSG